MYPVGNVQKSGCTAMNPETAIDSVTSPMRGPAVGNAKLAQPATNNVSAARFRWMFHLSAALGNKYTAQSAQIHGIAVTKPTSSPAGLCISADTSAGK